MLGLGCAEVRRSEGNEIRACEVRTRCGNKVGMYMYMKAKVQRPRKANGESEISKKNKKGKSNGRN